MSSAVPHRTQTTTASHPPVERGLASNPLDTGDSASESPAQSLPHPTAGLSNLSASAGEVVGLARNYSHDYREPVANR